MSPQELDAMRKHRSRSKAHMIDFGPPLPGKRLLTVRPLYYPAPLVEVAVPPQVARQGLARIVLDDNFRLQIRAGLVSLWIWFTDGHPLPYTGKGKVNDSDRLSGIDSVSPWFNGKRYSVFEEEKTFSHTPDNIDADTASSAQRQSPEPP